MNAPFYVYDCEMVCEVNTWISGLTRAELRYANSVLKVQIVERGYFQPVPTVATYIVDTLLLTYVE